MKQKKSPLGLKYSYRGELRGPDGNIKKIVENKNVVVDTGLDEILEQIGGLSAESFTYIAMGVDGTSHTYATTILNDEPAAGTFRKSASMSMHQSADGSVPQGAVLRLQATFNAGEATGTLYESGIFNVATKGGAGEALLAADDFAALVKGAADVLTWTWEITLTRT